MHVNNWAAAQREDPVLYAVLHWLEAKKKTDLRTLLGEHASSEEGQRVQRNHQNFTVLQDAFYLCSMLKGENECNTLGNSGFQVNCDILGIRST